MKSIFSAIMMLFMGFGVLCAQEAQKVTYADKAQIENFFKSKTMVVMDDNLMISYNIVISDAVKKYWTITPYEIITSKKFDGIYTDPNTSFIFLSKVELEKDKEDVCYLYMNIVMGGKVKDLTGLPELLSIPLAYSGVDEDAYVEKLPLMIRFAQLHLNNLKTAKNPKKLYNLKSYSSASKELKDKTLLVLEKDLSEQVNTMEKIQKEYSGAVKIVTPEEMIQAVEAKAANTAVLHQVSPGGDDNKGRSYCQIYGTDDAKLYYYNHQNITQRRPVGMLARDFHLITGMWH
jgi:hypothetical protein